MISFQPIYFYLAGQGSELQGAILEAGFFDKLQKSSCTVVCVTLFWQTDLNPGLHYCSGFCTIRKQANMMRKTNFFQGFKIY